MIGIFDSGIGGLTVVKEIKKVIPKASIIYFGDTARLPYGNKSPETIKKYSREIVEFLEKKGCGTIVIACNSASALAADWLRDEYPRLSIYDVVSSGAEAVAGVTKNKKVGIIGTTATINSGVYKKKIAELDSSIRVFTRACPLFVPLVEENWIKRPETKKIARTYLRPLKLQHIDTLLLGCTHYPLLEKVIGGVMGKRTKVIASGEKLTEKLHGSSASILEAELPLGDRKLAEELKKEYNYRGKEADKYFVSDLTEHFQNLAQKILNENIKIKKIVL